MLTQRVIFIVGILCCCCLTACGPMISGYDDNSIEPYLNHTRGSGNIRALEKAGAQVIVLGDTVRVILPSDRFFDRRSANLKSHKEPLMTNLTHLINNDQASHIAVIGYTDNVGSTNFKQTRTLQRARNVAGYLWAQGIHIERLSIVGAGGKNPVATNRIPDGSAYNRRIEIKFKKSA